MAALELLILAVSLSADAFAVSVCKGLAMPRVRWGQALLIALFFGGFQALMPLLGYFLSSSLSTLLSPVDHWIAFVLLAFIGGKMLLDGIKDTSEKESASSLNEPQQSLQQGSQQSSVTTDTADAADATGTADATMPVASFGASVALEASDNGSKPETPETSEKPGTSETTVSNLQLGELFMLAIATSIDALAVGVSFAFLGVDIFQAVSFIGLTTFILSLIGVVLGNAVGARYNRAATIVGGAVLILIGLKILFEHLELLG